RQVTDGRAGDIATLREVLRRLAQSAIALRLNLTVAECSPNSLTSRFEDIRGYRLHIVELLLDVFLDPLELLRIRQEAFDALRQFLQIFLDVFARVRLVLHEILER